MTCYQLAERQNRSKVKNEYFCITDIGTHKITGLYLSCLTKEAVDAPCESTTIKGHNNREKSVTVASLPQLNQESNP